MTLLSTEHRFPVTRAWSSDRRHRMFINWRFGLRRRRRSVTTTPANASCEKQRTKKKVQRVRKLLFFNLFSCGWCGRMWLTSQTSVWASYLPAKVFPWHGRTVKPAEDVDAHALDLKHSKPTIPRDRSSPAQPISIRRAQSRKTNPTFLCVPREFLKKMSAMFDSNLVILTIG